MTRKNPFVRISWIETFPRLTRDDLAVIEAELRRLYPTMVIFPRSHHFHELGEEPRRPEMLDNMVDHFLPRIDLEWGYRSGQAIAVRIPWPEDIATGNPQRLIGRPHRRPFDDSKEAFRRFGRTVYFKADTEASRMMLCGTTIQPPAELLAKYCDVPATDMPPFRYLGATDGFKVEIPHDIEDPEVVSFVKTVTSIIGRVIVSTLCLYDGITGEPLVSYSYPRISKSFSQRCAVEPHLYHHFFGTYRGHPAFLGPTPAQRWKWRREFGLPAEPKPAALSIPKLLPHEMLKWTRENLVPVPNEFHVEENKLANRAMYDYVAAHTPGFVMPANPVIPRILAETDIWSEVQRSARESLRRYAEIGEAAYVSPEQLEQRNAALRRKPSRRGKPRMDLK